MIVEIKGRFLASGDLLATRIKVEEREADEIEVTAAIDSLGDSWLAAGGMVFVVDAKTIIMDQQKQRISFDELQAGMLVEVKARRQPDGTILALRIKLEDVPAGRVEVRGTITQLSGDTVAVEQTLFLVDAATVFLDRDNNTVSLADFAVGDFVEAEAQTQKDGIWVLKKLKKEDPVSMQGPVQTVAGSKLTVLNTPVLLSSNTLVVGLFNTLLDVSAIQAGADVSVQGTLTSNGEVLASTVVVNSDAVTSVAIDQGPTLPFNFSLEQNYPNPFNPSTTLRYRIESQQAQHVTLRIFNLLGQEVVTLVDAVKPAGSYSIVWNGRSRRGTVLPSGIYLARLQVGAKLQVRRLVLSK
ncbi:MAG: T9SS C-terminal target domain-containing protein [Calditrichaeota bacterium]|nr:MAG: T9SS C-terminal target domain-containing protein [Calditrichota bacterium]